jgi:putative ABC transport system substrate-binding protein
MRELGYLEGRNVSLALRFAEGLPERMPLLATELVGLKPELIIAAPETSLFAVRSVTRTIPIITIWLQDPVSSGAVDSIARPGGHVTGTWIAGDDALVGKRLELLKEAVPTIARIGVLVGPAEVQDSVIMRLLSAPARALGLTVTIIQVRDATGIESAFASAARDNVQALFVSQSPLFNTHRVEIAARAVRGRLPAIYGFRELADAGGLMSYGPSLPAVYRRFAALADKILKGANPADLPVEVPTRFELIVNLKAAKAIDLTIPESFLLRADEVIE